MRIPPHTVRQIHFVGIGGIGMSGIAEVLHNLGYKVTGSDLSENVNIQRLRSLGVTVFTSHNSENVEQAQVVVVSTAVKEDNPELMEARRKRIPVIHRSEMLAELMRLKFAVAISGTHGKTTTTSLTAALFDAAGLDPTVVNGGIINSYGTNARLGKGDWIVVEADESDGSFTRLPATISVVTNIDPEHMDHYEDFNALKKAFSQFIKNIPFYGLGVLCIDHPEVKAMLPQVSDRRIITYGFSEEANVRAVNLRDSQSGITFDVDIVTNGVLAQRSLSQGRIEVLPRRIKDIFLPMMGRHNVQNCLSVVAIALELGLNDSVIRQAFSEFKGVKRRFTRVGESQGITVIDDYAHHPVEIKTVIKAAQQATKGRLIAVVQPHRYTRLHHLFSDFCSCFDGVDAVIVAPVYAAGEQPIPGASADALADGIRKQGITSVCQIQDPSELPIVVRNLAQAGDMVLCLGAGSITYWAAALPTQLDQLAVESHKRLYPPELGSGSY
jgi:UDP-N-acetylmuramate--alanine ligase